MFHPRLLVVFLALLAMAAAQLQCDPVTQYEDRGRCCLKCEPGTSMKSGSSCEEPQCKECEDNEYQEKYTTATKCERQDYCDENRNFKWRTLQNKKKRIPCECKDGFHCSSELCLTCVPHRMCPPGLGARSIGNHTHDTVCEKCPEGQFSNDSSWRSVCQKWTVCGNNFHVSKEGTAESDVECEPTLRHILAIPIVLVAVVLLVLVFGVCWYKRRREQGSYKMTLEKNICTEEKKDLIKDVEKGELRKPEENEHNPSLSDQTGVTANGNTVTQECGKSEVLPRQESQTDTTTTSHTFDSPPLSYDCQVSRVSSGGDSHTIM
ncbi:tumor necrosis factor receptor superfamily member 5 [Salarias fasciatus]|uniref:tumor necrosis factor receptor superfamily member 5 n=1 Tax=Salarias fasciatus TaxID=181472 RepID=UPI001176806B|nr:tumor necrosis factor receptor superfamily member 5-like [Salarias fasciatus]